MSNEELIQMVKDAHKACENENMHCPWCSGSIRYDSERHDNFCNWVKLKKEMDMTLQDAERRHAEYYLRLKREGLATEDDRLQIEKAEEWLKKQTEGN